MRSDALICLTTRLPDSICSRIVSYFASFSRRSRSLRGLTAGGVYPARANLVRLRSQQRANIQRFRLRVGQSHRRGKILNNQTLYGRNPMFAPEATTNSYVVSVPGAAHDSALDCFRRIGSVKNADPVIVVASNVPQHDIATQRLDLSVGMCPPSITHRGFARRR